MKIEIRKINFEPKKINFRFKDSGADIVLIGKLYRVDNGLVKLDSIIQGDIKLTCYLSGEPFVKSINDNISFLIKDGIWTPKHSKNFNYDDFDVLECFDGYIDLQKIVISELESIKLDYHTKDN